MTTSDDPRRILCELAQRLLIVASRVNDEALFPTERRGARLHECAEDLRNEAARIEALLDETEG